MRGLGSSTTNMHAGLLQLCSCGRPLKHLGIWLPWFGAEGAHPGQWPRQCNVLLGAGGWCCSQLHRWPALRCVGGAQPGGRQRSLCLARSPQIPVQPKGYIACPSGTMPPATPARCAMARRNASTSACAATCSQTDRARHHAELARRGNGKMQTNSGCGCNLGC